MQQAGRSATHTTKRKSLWALRRSSTQGSVSKPSSAFTGPWGAQARFQTRACFTFNHVYSNKESFTGRMEIQKDDCDSLSAGQQPLKHSRPVTITLQWTDKKYLLTKSPSTSDPKASTPFVDCFPRFMSLCKSLSSLHQKYWWRDLFLPISSPVDHLIVEDSIFFLGAWFSPTDN